VKRVTQRYLVASGGFAVAAWLSGVGLVSGFGCLLAFALTAFVVGVVQRRQQVVESGRARRSGSGRSHSEPGVIPSTGPGEDALLFAALQDSATWFVTELGCTDHLLR